MLDAKEGRGAGEETGQAPLLVGHSVHHLHDSVMDVNVHHHGEGAAHMGEDEVNDIGQDMYKISIGIDLAVIYPKGELGEGGDGMAGLVKGHPYMVRSQLVSDEVLGFLTDVHQMSGQHAAHCNT